MDVMYVIVRTDLKMSKGKIAAQCCHAVQGITMISNIKYICPKICLKVNNVIDMDMISKYCIDNTIPHYQVIDAGLTQVPPMSKTVLGVGPIKKSNVPDIIKDLKLL